MQRLYATERPRPTKKGPRVFDIVHLVPHGWSENGVRWGSRIICGLEAGPWGTHRIELYVPGIHDGTKFDLSWGAEELAKGLVPVLPAFEVQSVADGFKATAISLGRVDENGKVNEAAPVRLEFFMQLNPGMAA